MTDIVERLRLNAGDKTKAVMQMDGILAADEIERLRAERDAAVALMERMLKDWPNVECLNFNHRKKDRNHPIGVCPPRGRFAELRDEIDTFIAQVSAADHPSVGDKP